MACMTNMLEVILSHPGKLLALVYPGMRAEACQGSTIQVIGGLGLLSGRCKECERLGSHLQHGKQRMRQRCQIARKEAVSMASSRETASAAHTVDVCLQLGRKVIVYNVWQAAHMQPPRCNICGNQHLDLAATESAQCLLHSEEQGCSIWLNIRSF